MSYWCNMYMKCVDYVYLVHLLIGFILIICGRRSQRSRSWSARGGLAAGLLILAGGGACEPPVATS